MLLLSSGCDCLGDLLGRDPRVSRNHVRDDRSDRPITVYREGVPYNRNKKLLRERIAHAGRKETISVHWKPRPCGGCCEAAA